MVYFSAALRAYDDGRRTNDRTPSNRASRGSRHSVMVANHGGTHPTRDQGNGGRHIDLSDILGVDTFRVIRPEGTNRRSREYRRTISRARAATLVPREGPFMPYSYGRQGSYHAQGETPHYLSRQCTNRARFQNNRGTSAPPNLMHNRSQRTA